eukprot:gnl/TRDRNA2_/TRDRNA2_145875_c2_seq1.p1 gnl/TRDRNA2_/TRDRNA2_145875_c2~~gnl/TRDRNA2_/TRDRNA2_145875_c2_seq1.p1  ORF type:complete len:501 (+),score=53.16 gnl/TRDRNA2_/TRDRNA2_145875_c2_seq1:218-1504(+)
MSIMVYQNALFAGRVVQYNDLEPVPERENFDHAPYLDFLNRWGTRSKLDMLEGRVSDTFSRVFLPLAHRVSASLPQGLAQRVPYEPSVVHEAIQDACLGSLPDYAALWQETGQPQCPIHGWEPSLFAQLGISRTYLAFRFEAFLENTLKRLVEFMEYAARHSWIQLPPPVESMPWPDPWPSAGLVKAFRLELALHCRIYELLVTDRARTQAFLESLWAVEEMRTDILPLLEQHWRPQIHSLLEAAHAFSMDSLPPAQEDWLLLHYDVAASAGGFQEARHTRWRDPRTWLLERRSLGSVHVVTEDVEVADVQQSCARALLLPSSSQHAVLVIARGTIGSTLAASVPTTTADWAVAGSGDDGDSMAWACLQELLQGWKYEYWIFVTFSKPFTEVMMSEDVVGAWLAGLMVPGVHATVRPRKDVSLQERYL